MITSSLPPELKVMIASGFLLGGGLLALRFPADRNEEPPLVAQAVAADRDAPSLPTASQDSVSTAPGSGAGSFFATVDDFVSGTENRNVSSGRTSSGGWASTSLSEHGLVSNEPAQNVEASRVAELSDLARESYGGMTLGNASGVSAETRANLQYAPIEAASEPPPPKPEYKPFQSANVTMPETNPAFFAELPSPPNLTGLTPPSVELNATPPVLPSTTTTAARPVLPIPEAQPTGTTRIAAPVAVRVATPVSPLHTAQGSPVANPNAVPVTAQRTTGSGISGGQPQGDIFYAPARTVILPNR